MSMKLNIEKEKSLKKFVFNIAGGMLSVFFCLFFSAIVSVAWVYIADKDLSSYGYEPVSLFLQKLASDPFFIFTAYADWWQGFQKNTVAGLWTFSSFIPLIVPIVSILVLCLFFLKKSYVFSLWFILNHRFAHLKDVVRMNLLEGSTLVLGFFQGRLLGIFQPSSVLCFGDAGSGKTSSVAVPSILHSDDVCVLAVDNSGTLAKYTSGYRARLGKVFYFNWDLQDDEEKGICYPRWNPLAECNIPQNEDIKNKYLFFLADYLAEYDNVDSGSYWQWSVTRGLETFLHFVVSKVEHAKANDFFLNKILENGHLNNDDKDVLLSYYAMMPPSYATVAKRKIREGKIQLDDYFPIGSWEGLPAVWQGKDACLSMVADWLLKSYLMRKNRVGDWLEWLESLLQETILFNYSLESVVGLKELISLSKKQRQIIFPMMLKSLMVFRNAQVRERTTGNDFKMSMLRGIRQNKTVCPVTVYSTANTKSTKFVSRLFIEVALHFNLSEIHGNRLLPLVVVMDDVAQMMKVQTLREAVARGRRRSVSFLLLCNSLSRLEQLYGKECVEELIVNTNYKIIMAEDNKMMSNQLNKLAEYGTKSVQIPVDKKKRRWKNKSPADASYYRRLAKLLLSKRDLNIDTFGYHLLLSEGFYHRPILAKNISFMQDRQFKVKSLLDAVYVLDDELLARRHSQDMSVPDAEELIVGDESGFDDETDLKQYVSFAYDEALCKISEAETAVSSSVVQKEEDSAVSDWWMDEEAFNVVEKSDGVNPFMKKIL